MHGRAFDDEQKTLFLKALEEKGLISTAAASIGVGEETIRRHRSDDADFAAAMVEASAKYLDALRSAAKTRAIHGTIVEEVTETRADGTEVVRIKRQYSDTVLIKLLTRHDKGMVERSESTAKVDATVHTKKEIELKGELKKLDHAGRAHLREVLKQLNGSLEPEGSQGSS